MDLQFITSMLRNGLQVKNISGDKQTVVFKGKNSDSIHINFKNAGYRFQADALCNDGYNLYFYFYNNLSYTLIGYQYSTYNY